MFSITKIDLFLVMGVIFSKLNLDTFNIKNNISKLEIITKM